MPAAFFRMNAARISRTCEATSASAGASRSVRAKSRENRMRPARIAASCGSASGAQEPRDQEPGLVVGRAHASGRHHLPVLLHGDGVPERVVDCPERQALFPDPPVAPAVPEEPDDAEL